MGAEGYDIYNYGAAGSKGTTQVTVAAGFRTRLTDKLHLGIAWQTAVAEPKGYFDDRVVVDLCIRF